jgi:hypothetical protein
LIVRVKYCGGCNASYDRLAFVKRLQDAFPSARFVFRDAGSPASNSDLPDFVLAVCGCSVACAARGDVQVQGNRGQFAATSQNDFTSVCDEIRRTIEKREYSPDDDAL